MKTPVTLILVPCLLMLSACDGDAGDRGTLVVSAHGGVEAREGIPASRTADGYAIHYDHVLVEFEDLRLETRGGDSADVAVVPIVVELVPAPSEVFVLDDVPAQRWDAVRFSSRPVPEGARLGPGVDTDLVQMMRERGYSLYLEGTLEGPVPPDGEPGEVPFAFGVPVAIDYLDCTSGDGTLGVVVPPSATAEAEITWHLTHTWFDSFVEDAALRGEAFAAAWTGDGPLTLEDLATQTLSRLRGVTGELLVDDGGNPLQYLPGMTGARDLREFVLAHRYAHWNGLEGQCRTMLTVVE